MPSFFDFQQGTESRTRLSVSDTTPLLGRFRAVPNTGDFKTRARRSSSVDFWKDLSRRSYGSLFAAANGESEGDDDGERGFWNWLRRRGRGTWELWVEPKKGAVRGVVERFWWRWWVLMGLPALMAVAWCAVPFPQYEFEDDDDDDVVVGALKRLGKGIGGGPQEGTAWTHSGHRVPGHGEAIVELNFWFFLFVYYAVYNVTALMWVTKVFNIYSLNWWPKSIGFPLTFLSILAFSITLPIPLYCIPSTKFITEINTVWICWTFITMALPLAVAFFILMSNERHRSLRHSLSDTQRIFTSSWWTGDPIDTISGRPHKHGRRAPIPSDAYEPDAPLHIGSGSGPRRERRIHKRWIPASFVRFMWFCLALLIGLLAYVLGEVYAEIYLRTLPHNNIETIFYVYSWVITIHLLDSLTGFILGGDEGQRVGSYPLGWVFKLYFMLTYQTYVRALYARLRSPSQFIILQVLSSSLLIVLTPLSMSSLFHWFLQILGLNTQPYADYRKFCGRNIFIRGLAENVSMLAFLGEVVVLHFGPNKDVYPYFAFDNAAYAPVPNATLPWIPGYSGSAFNASIHPSRNQTVSSTHFNLNFTYPYPHPHNPSFGNPTAYDFNLTFYASMVTWACEIVAGWVVRRIVWWGFGFAVTDEGKKDLVTWPELLPTGVVVMVHVLQNMLFGVVRLSFR